MNALIQITTNEQGSQVVSARELHAFLEVKTPLEKWMPRMVEYGFSQGVDYQQIDKIVQLGNGAKRVVLDDYALTLDTAKELAMLQRTDKGQQARRYFIECEKQLKASPALTQIEVLMQSVQLLAKQERDLAEVKALQAEQGESIRMLEAKTTTIPDYFTVAGYANLNRINIGLKTASSVGQKASRICKERGYMMETTPDPRFGQVNMYPSQVLKEVFSQPIT
jgi:phage anti-repressor protein